MNILNGGLKVGILTWGFYMGISNGDLKGDFVRGFCKGETAWGLCMLI